MSFTESVEDVNEAYRFRKVLSKDTKSIRYIKGSDGIRTDFGLETLNLLASSADGRIERSAERHNQPCVAEDVS